MTFEELYAGFRAYMDTNPKSEAAVLLDGDEPLQHELWISGSLPEDSNDTCFIGIMAIRAEENRPPKVGYVTLAGSNPSRRIPVFQPRNLFWDPLRKAFDRLDQPWKGSGI